MNEVLRGGQAVRGRELVIEGPNGKKFVSANIDPLFDAQSALLGGVACFHDVTEPKRTEALLIERERWYRELLDALPAAIYTTDADGRITFYNQAAIELAGTKPQIGTDQWCVTWRLHRPDGTPLPHDECPMAIAIKENRPVRGEEAVAERPDGSLIPLIPYPTPLRDAAGALVGAVNMLVDIRDRKTAELERQRLVAELRRLNETLERRVEERTRALTAEIEERQAMEERLHQLQKTEAIGQLTGGLAHDFNNLLTAVMGNLDFIALKSPDEIARKHATAALRAARRGADLTQQLLAFSRKQRLEFRATNLNELVTGMGELLLRTLGGDVRVELALGQGLWPALIDASQIETAILNLALNARDAMPNGGTVTLETQTLRIGKLNRVAGLEPGDYVVVAVSDTGTGMTDEVKMRAFDPFFTTKDIGKGSGLGLSQVYGVARQSGGAAEIDTALGRGTTIRLYLPRAHVVEESLDARPAEAAGPASQGLQILVVDDDEAVRDVIVATLNNLGYAVTAANSGASAIAQLARAAYDLVILDLAMPEMNGVAARQAIRERWPDLPVLFASGYAGSTAFGTDIAEAFILRKPFVSAELDAKIRAALAAHPAVRAGNVIPLRTGAA